MNIDQLVLELRHQNDRNSFLHDSSKFALYKSIIGVQRRKPGRMVRETAGGVVQIYGKAPPFMFPIQLSQAA